MICIGPDTLASPAQMARSKKTAIIFFDEIDALGGAPGGGGESGRVRGAPRAM